MPEGVWHAGIERVFDALRDEFLTVDLDDGFESQWRRAIVAADFD